MATPKRIDYTPIDSGAKVGVVGVGAVGSACAFALLLRGSCGEIVLIDRDAKRAAGVAADIRYGEPLSRATVVRAGGYEDLEGAAVVLITAGVNEKTGGATDRSDPEGRLRLVDVNAQIYREIVPQILAAAPEAVIVAVTDPPEPLAEVALNLARHDRVLSTGTLLDSLRFRLHIATRLGVDPGSVDATVVGEHGTSQVLLWTSARVGGASVEQALAERFGEDSLDQLRAEIDHDVRYANITIIEGNSASQFGIGAACARIAEAVLGDERVVLPVGSYSERHGVILSLPSVISRAGVERVIEPEMTSDEQEALTRSADVLRRTRDRVRVNEGAHALS